MISYTQIKKSFCSLIVFAWHMIYCDAAVNPLPRVSVYSHRPCLVTEANNSNRTHLNMKRATFYPVLVRQERCKHMIIFIAVHGSMLYDVRVQYARIRHKQAHRPPDLQYATSGGRLVVITFNDHRSGVRGFPSLLVDHRYCRIRSSSCHPNHEPGAADRCRCRNVHGCNLMSSAAYVGEEKAIALS